MSLFSKIFVIIVSVFLLYGNQDAFAQIGNGQPAPGGNVIDNGAGASGGTFGNFEVGLPGGSNFRKGQSIDQFIQGASNAPIKTLVNYLVTFAIGILVIIGVITIVIGGYLYMTAAGNASQVGSAKEMITSALIGIFIAFVSVVILNTINPYLGSKAVEPTIPSPSGSPGAIIDQSNSSNTSGNTTTNTSNTTNSGQTTAQQLQTLQTQQTNLDTQIQTILIAGTSQPRGLTAAQNATLAQLKDQRTVVDNQINTLLGK